MSPRARAARKDTGRPDYAEALKDVGFAKAQLGDRAGAADALCAADRAAPGDPVVAERLAGVGVACT